MQLENRAALYNFASIATAADGLILSRGNLGLDVAPEKMALVQKSVVNRCNLLGKPVVITRVLDTMATAPRPTRSTPFTTESGPSLSTTNSFGHFATVASYPSKLVLCSSCCHSILHSNWSRWAAKSDLHSLLVECRSLTLLHQDM